MSLISQAIQESLCEQISAERYNASLYLYIFSVLKNKGLDNLAKHFEEQAIEENGHAKKIIDFMTDLNSDVTINMVKEVEPLSEGFTIINIADLYLNREIDTTESLDEIKKLCLSESNPVAEEFLRTMILEQRKEYEEATTWKDKAALTDGNWSTVLLWDSSYN